VERPEILLLGASGFLGRNLLRAEAEKRMVAVSREPEKHASVGGACWIGLEDWIGELRRMRERGPVSVIHAMALTDHAYCERHPEEAMQVNGRDVAEAALACRALETPFIYVCTDGLFSNLEVARAPRYWSLDDPPDPVSAYGRSKLAGERALAELGWGHSVRMSFVGPSLGTGRGLIAFLARRLREGREVPGFADTWFTPAPVQGAAARLLELAAVAEGGHSVRQWGSWPAMTKYEYLDQVAQAAGLTATMLPQQRGSYPDSESVPLDQSLTCEAPWSRRELIDLGAQALLEDLG
jgi:dTDP-4-dehydrorhamnose reductase